MIEKHLTLRRADGGPDFGILARARRVRTAGRGNDRSRMPRSAGSTTRRRPRKTRCATCAARSMSSPTWRRARCSPQATCAPSGPASGCRPRHLPEILGRRAAKRLRGERRWIGRWWSSAEFVTPMAKELSGDPYAALPERPRVLALEWNLPFYIDVAARLAERHNWHFVYWVGDRALLGNRVLDRFPDVIFHDTVDARYARPPAAIADLEPRPFDETMARMFAYEKAIALKMMDRFELEESFTFGDRVRLFHRLAGWWTALLDRIQPDILIIPTAPHVVTTTSRTRYVESGASGQSILRMPRSSGSFSCSNFRGRIPGSHSYISSASQSRYGVGSDLGAIGSGISRGQARYLSAAPRCGPFPYDLSRNTRAALPHSVTSSAQARENRECEAISALFQSTHKLGQGRARALAV